MRNIAVKAVVDVLGALVNLTLRDSLYLFDSNRAHGSQGLGTSELSTAVRKGDNIDWLTAPLSCETFVEISGISIPPDICRLEQRTFPGTNIRYWTGTVLRDIDLLPYSLTFALGPTGMKMVTENGPRLIGQKSDTNKATKGRKQV
jgi:hypothetical protein